MSLTINDSGIKCCYCGKFGHSARNFHKKLDENRHRHKKHVGNFVDENQNQDLRLFMSDSVLSAENDEAETWFLDFGASTHMTGNKHWFENFKDTNNGANIYLGDDKGYQIKGYGNIHVILHDGNIRRIKNVMYVPGIKTNMIYVSMITDHN